MDTIHIYTDGACSGNPGPGGAAAILIRDNKIFHKVGRGFKRTTNNRMEIKAVTYGLNAAKKLLSKASEIVIHTDSQIVYGALEQGWKKMSNKDLWNELDLILFDLKQQHSIKAEKVAGHSGDMWNDQVDALAVKLREMDNSKLLEDEGYGNNQQTIQQPVKNLFVETDESGMKISFKPGDKAWVVTRKTAAGGGYDRDRYAYEVNYTKITDINIRIDELTGFVEVCYHGDWNLNDYTLYHRDTDDRLNRPVSIARDKVELKNIFEEYKKRIGKAFDGFYINEQYSGDPRKCPPPAIWK